MKERVFTTREVLLAAACPDFIAESRDGDKPHIKEHIKGRCVALVDPTTHSVLTVKCAATDKSRARKAVAQ